MEQVLVVTGGSRGIGAETARLAAKRGYAVAVNYRERADAAHLLVEEIQSNGGRAIAVQADVAIAAATVKLLIPLAMTAAAKAEIAYFVGYLGYSSEGIGVVSSAAAMVATPAVITTAVGVTDDLDPFAHRDASLSLDTIVGSSPVVLSY